MTKHVISAIIDTLVVCDRKEHDGNEAPHSRAVEYND